MGVSEIFVEQREQQSINETAKSFNVLASVTMLREDLYRYGAVLPETRQRVADEELSLLAEGIDKASRTTFTLPRDGSDLMYIRNGEATSYTGMLLGGLEVARREASEDFRKQFLADDAIRDLEIGYAMRRLSPGEQIAWASPYPYDIEEKYGATFLKEECGRFPERKMAFLYLAMCQEDGNVVLESQTIDQSHDHALLRAVDIGMQGGGMDEMVAANDEVMSETFDGPYRFGRLYAQANENAWEQIKQQEDLVGYLLRELEVLAASPLQDAELEVAVKKHMYGVWAAFSNRLQNQKAVQHQPESVSPNVQTQPHPVYMQQLLLAQEVRQAFREYVSSSRIMAGCGGSIRMTTNEDDIFSAEPRTIMSDVFPASSEDDYGPLTFKCTEGHTNHRRRGQLLKECQTRPCKKGSVGCG